MSMDTLKSRSMRMDEFDLLEIFQRLWKQKVLIFSFAMSVTLCGVAYVFLATPYYQVQSVLRPAPLKDLDELNSTGVYELSPEEALRRVGAALDSYSIRAEFFQRNPDLFSGLPGEGRTQEQRFETFNAESFSLLQSDPKRIDNLSSFVGLKMVYPKTLDGVAILNGIVQQAIANERQRVVQDVQSVVRNRLSKIERKMSAERASYEAQKEAEIAKLNEDNKLQSAVLQDELDALRAELHARRQSRIEQLGEAIVISNSLGIKKPSDSVLLGGGQLGNTSPTGVMTPQYPLHLMGAEVLEAERAALLKRKSDDHAEPEIAILQKRLQMLERNRQVELMQARQNEDLFLANLSEMREDAARLRSISRDLDFDQLVLVRIDRPAVEPLAPVKPKKFLVVGLAFLFGSMLGVFFAVFRRV